MNPGSSEAVGAARKRTLQIIAAMRAHGARFYWEYMGAHVSSSPGDTGAHEGVAAAEAHTLGATGFVAPGMLATVADIALAVCIRPTVPPAHRTATFGLTLQILREASTWTIRARANLLSMSGQTAVAQCRLLDDMGDPLALATGAFAIRPIPRGAPWLPYSNDRAIAASDFPPVD